MGRESIHDKLSRVRPPRVHITYDVHTGGAIEKKELPFIMGVMGDFGGKQEAVTKLKERQFVDINPDNFDDVLSGMKPHLEFAVENKLSEDPDAKPLAIKLDFAKLEDFEPEQVARKVPALNELLKLRSDLGNLRGVLNDDFDQLLLIAISNTEKLEKLKGQLDEAGGGDNA
ncbi:MAG: type VI secretion system contractile sheath small subunit [Bryobacteraceae bacterium]